VSRKLVVSDGTRERELQLVGRLVVGRDPTCDITHDHSLLSRRHAEFVSAGGIVVVRDLGSRNGVFVNGAKTAEHSLHPGDVVQIGPLRAQYVVDESPLSIAPEDHDTDRTAVFRGPSTSSGSRAGSRDRPAPEPSPPPVDVARGGRELIERPPADDDDEATRLITAKPPAARPAPPPSLDVARDGPERVQGPADPPDDDETRFIPRKPSLDSARDGPERVEGPAALDDESADEGMAQAAAPAPAFEHEPALADAPLASGAVTEPLLDVAGERSIVAVPSLRGYLFAQLLVFAALIIIVFVVALLGAGVSTPLPALLVTAVVAAAAAFIIAGLTDGRITRVRSAQDVP
jgi:hypothetical protein